MSTTRLLFKQNNTAYRFLRLETSSEGGLTILLDRDVKKSEGNKILKDGIWSDEIQDRDNQFKITLHTTGEIHYKIGSKSAPKKDFIEPLYSLTQSFKLALLSIPQISKLNEYSERDHKSDIKEIKSIPDEMDSRFTFSISISPINSNFDDKDAICGMMSIDYEIYSIKIAWEKNLLLDDDMKNHFVNVAIEHKKFLAPSVGMAVAETSFYNKVHGEKPKIFRHKNGSYIVMTPVPMRIKPT